MRSSRHNCSSDCIWKRTNDSLGGRLRQRGLGIYHGHDGSEEIDASAMITNVVSLKNSQESSMRSTRQAISVR